MLFRLLLLIGLFTGYIAAQPVVGPGPELWPLMEVKEPGDTAFTIGGPAKRSFPRGAPTTLRFSLTPNRPDTLYLVFSRGVNEMVLTNTSGEQLINGTNWWGRERSFRPSRRVFAIPPDWEGPLTLTLKNNYYHRLSRYDTPFTIKLLGKDFHQYYADHIDLGRPRPDRSSQLFFFYVFGGILFLVCLAWVASRRAIFGAYLVYNGTVWLYYFIRKAGGMGYSWWITPSYFRYSFEATASILIIPAYLFFLRRFLRLGASAADQAIDQQITWMSRAALVAATIVFLTCCFVSVGWGFAFSITTNVVLLCSGLLLLWRVHRRGDHFSRVIVWAAFALVLGIGVLYAQLGVKYWIKSLPDPDIYGLSYFQIGVLIETIILFYGVLVWAGRRADFLGADAGAEQGQAAGPPPLPTTLTINNKVIPTKDLLYVRSSGDHFVLHYRTGDPKVFNGRLTIWYREVLPGLPHFVRIQKSITVNLAQTDHYQDNGSCRLYFKDNPETLEVTADYRAHFIERFALRP